MGLKIAKAPGNRRFQHIVDEIEAGIIAGDLKTGDQLPPELELKEMFGTGRGTVREALRVLEEKGLIVTRAGASGGAFVKDADPAKLTEHLTLLVQARSIASDHIRELREVVEPEAAALAARRITTGDSSPLEAALAQANASCKAGDHDGYLHADVAAHVAIAELTGNPLLTAVLRMVHEHVLGYSEEYSLASGPSLAENLDDLSGLVNAVLQGRENESRDRALAHVQQFHGHLADKGDQ